MDDLRDLTIAAPGGEPTLEAAAPLPLVAAPPDPGLAAVVTVPVRNEAAFIERLLKSLLCQRNADGTPCEARRFETILLFDRCTDGSAALARAFARRHPSFRLHGVVPARVDVCGHVGDVRRLLMDEAARRLMALDRPDGVILSTDADSEVAPDWLARNLEVIRAGWDAVGGQVLLRPADREALHPAARRRYLLDHAYQRLTCLLEGLIDPDPDDPLPRHHQHAGASLAVTAGAYRRAGGMPALPTGEDTAFYEAVRASGGRFRRSVKVRVNTSGRLAGRADGGVAQTLGRWAGTPGQARVMSAGALEAQFLARTGRARPNGHPPPREEELEEAVRGLRQRVVRYRDLARRSSR